MHLWTLPLGVYKFLEPASHKSTKNKQHETGLNAVETAVLSEGLREVLKIVTLALCLHDTLLVKEMWSPGSSPSNQVFWQQ